MKKSFTYYIREDEKDFTRIGVIFLHVSSIISSLRFHLFLYFKNIFFVLKYIYFLFSHCFDILILKIIF
jgi:hypothetical protein